MKFVIPLRRAMPEALAKAMGHTRGGGGAHKYVRRQRIFVGGKLRWRYFYLDDPHRSTTREHHDPHDKHEHHLVSDLKDLHPNLKGKALAAVEATVEFIKGLFGFKGKPGKVEVSATPAWGEKHHAPYVKEESGEDDTIGRGNLAPEGRSPQARVAKAIEMIPEHLKEMVGRKKIEGEGGGAPGLTKFVLTDISDEDIWMQMMGVAGWHMPSTGEIHITSLALGRGAVDGPAKYESPLTRAEEVVWHEFGHSVHRTLEGENPGMWKDWIKTSQGDPGNKISTYPDSYQGKPNNIVEKEDFAESFACAISYPKQLAQECEVRYDWIRKNIMPDLPSRADILATVDEDLQWWNPKPSTPATRVLGEARRNKPAARYAPYYSDQDQFYLVNRDGRQVYLRIGPPDKQAEANWERMPATIDPETELPRYEGGIYNRFRAAETLVKEIYDEHGNPLDDRQAWLHLGQDDEKVVKHVESLSEDPTAAMEKLYDEAGSSQKGSLGREMFNAMGGNLFVPPKAWAAKLKDAKDKHGDKSPQYKKIFDEMLEKVPRDQIRGTRQYEHKRVSRERTKGKTGEAARHDWAPVEVSPAEFLAKSGTFKFAEVRDAPDEKQTVRLRENGKDKMIYDPAKGRHVPVLSSRLYEQQNPDGTWTKIRVSEDNAFSAGMTISAPQKFVRVGDERFTAEQWQKMPKAEKKKYEGIDTRTYTAWEPYTLTENDDIDPEVLARKFDTSARSLLHANAKTGYGQLSDPVLAALLNPEGRHKIRSAADLQALMREAAEDDPPRRSWVSIKGPSAHGQARSVAHIQVEWDGAGPPKVVGDYWARKLGKAEIRLDELLDSKDEIKLPRVEEPKGLAQKKAPVANGQIVFIRAPKTGKRIMATYIEAAPGGKHKVQPIAGQGSGIEKKLITVSKVEARPATVIPDPAKVGLRRRFVKPLKNDLLIYADEVPEGGGETAPGGVLRVLLPEDGSITMEQLRSVPGLNVEYKRDLDQVVDKVEGEMAAALGVSPQAPGRPVASLSIRDLPRVREALGGFVMDERVRALIDHAMQTERIAREMAGEDEVVSDEDIEGPDGNINPDGVLKGLVTGDDGIQPGEHRRKALKKLAKNGGRLFAAHFMGTGKTALAIMASKMMRQLKDTDGNPHPNRTTKKTLMLVPLNTAENWYQEFKKFAGAPPTMIGASTLAGAQQVPKLPPRKERENDKAYTARVMDHWRAELEKNPALWNPFTDANENVVVPYEYFRDNEEALRLTGKFDGMIPDEAHKIARENEVSRAVERWNKDMKLFMPMTGTPITNTLDTLPRIIRLVSAGQVDLGSEKQFQDEWLQPSAVALAMGAKNPPKTDLKPNKVGELMLLIQAYMDVANTTDVKGQNMPAVLLDENEPAHMEGQQATMYRAAMAEMTPADLAALESSSALGLDEAKLLDPEARRKVAVARSIANCPAYKAPDLREEMQYQATIALPDKKRESADNTKEVPRAFRLPEHKQILAGSWDSSGSLDKKQKKKHKPHWPSQQDVMDGLVQAGYLAALHKYGQHLFGKDYVELEGKPITKAMLEAIKKGSHETDTGLQWAGKIVNPDYGPEGMICRGQVDPITKEITPLPYKWTDENGNEHDGVIAPGELFVRDPNRKAAGIFYHSDDWDHTGRFEDTGEGVEDESEAGASQKLRDEGWMDHPTEKKKIWLPETGEEKDKPKGWAKKIINQQPKTGREAHSVQFSTERRQQRAMFDKVVTHNNAKCDALQAKIKNVLSEKHGDPDGGLTQFIHFGNRVGSSCRTMEAKFRDMGFQDVNEALGHPDVSSEGDKAKRPRKYFVTYFGKGATAGDRSLNSEIFRRVQDKYGTDTGVSMFVQRTLYGNTKRPPKLGEIIEGWSAGERKDIAANFMDASGRTKKDGSPAGLEVPMRCMGVENGKGEIVPNYVYESDLSAKERKEIKRLEILGRGAVGAAKDKIEDDIRAVLEPHWTDRIALTDHQQYVFNNTQHMVASDAANVGLNWPAAHLTMYDSLFSPMDEWQRITRAARMLPPAVSKEAAPIVDKIDKWIRQNEVDQMVGMVDYDEQTAISVIQDAMDGLNVFDQAALADMAEGSPEMLVEAYFAKRSLERIQGLREDAQTKLRKEGYWPDPDTRDALIAELERAKLDDDQGEMKRLNDRLQGLFVPPAAIQASDVTNYIIRQELSPFERKMMRDRRFLVDVHRLTVSCEMPEIVYEKVKVGNKTVKIKVMTGETIIESPVRAEKAVLQQQRQKMVPYEFMMNAIQNATPESTPHDFVNSHVGSLGTTSTTDKNASEVVELYPDIHVADLPKSGIAIPAIPDAPKTVPTKPKLVVPKDGPDTPAEPEPEAPPEMPKSGRPLRKHTGKLIQKMTKRQMAAQAAYHSWLVKLTDAWFDAEADLVESKHRDTDAHRMVQAERERRAKGVKKSDARPRFVLRAGGMR